MSRTVDTTRHSANCYCKACRTDRLAETTVKVGEYFAIDLDENNRAALDARRDRFPGREFPALGWGVCRHGHGLQDLPPLSEVQARHLADKLNA